MSPIYPGSAMNQSAIAPPGCYVPPHANDDRTFVNFWTVAGGIATVYMGGAKIVKTFGPKIVAAFKAWRDRRPEGERAEGDESSIDMTVRRPNPDRAAAEPNHNAERGPEEEVAAAIAAAGPDDQNENVEVVGHDPAHANDE